MVTPRYNKERKVKACGRSKGMDKSRPLLGERSANRGEVAGIWWLQSAAMVGSSAGDYDMVDRLR
jgi:hypothetical protein